MRTQNTNRRLMKTIFSIAILFIGIVAKAQIISFTDPNLKAKLLTPGSATDIYGDPIIIDTNGNGEIEVSEALAIPNLNVSGASISSLVDLAPFTNLQSIQANDNLLTTVNISGRTSLLGFSAQNNQLTSISINGLPNLTYLDVGTNQLTSIDLSGVPALQWFVCKNNLLTAIDVSNHTSLYNAECDSNGLTSLNVLGCSNLHSLICNNNSLTSLNLNGLGQLLSVECNNNQINTINLSGLASVQTLSCSQNQLSAINLAALPALKTLTCGTNLFTSLDCTVNPLLESLYCDHNQLTSLIVTGLLNLKNIGCQNNSLTSLNVSNLPNLQILYCQYNLITSLDVSNSTNLTSFHCFANSLSTLSVSNLNALIYLYCWDNQLTSLTVTNNAQLKQLYCYNNQLPSITIANLPMMDSLSINDNQVTSLDISGFPSLIFFAAHNNILTSLNVTGLVLLETLDCDTNQLTNIDTSDNTNLQQLYCKNNLITALNISTSSNFCYLTCDNNPLLETVFMKSGSLNCPLIENTFSNCPNLRYVCADEWRINVLNNYFTSNSMDVVVNTYCSFSPGGNYNTISGTVTYDANNNGCDTSDVLEPNIRIDIDDHTTQGATFTNTNGLYGFFTQAGNFDVYLNIENPSFFNLSPQTNTINFPDNNNNVTTQNFCITANGVHPDLEVVISPVGAARPGFDARYNIVYKNKGTQMLSGTVSLTFDDALTDLVDSVPTPDAVATNSLSWNYVNLMPFENRSILVTLNLNTPAETPALHNGDILNFTTAITPLAGDELSGDNEYNYNQTVVGSYDPNSVECLEGEMVSPTEIGEYLHYAINFENLGTYEAENIVVRSEIDTTKYDIASLQVMNTSHPSYTKITGNIIEFVFENINLAAAHGTPPVGGHGDVLFKIRTKDDLVNNDTVIQRAGIYFDYNFPVDTNDAVTTFATLSNPIFEFDDSVKIYPNPTNAFINISSEFAIESIEMYDIQGRILETHFETSTFTKLDISGKSNGIYFLKIKTEKGSKVEKIVKE